MVSIDTSGLLMHWATAENCTFKRSLVQQLYHREAIHILEAAQHYAAHAMQLHLEGQPAPYACTHAEALAKWAV